MHYSTNLRSSDMAYVGLCQLKGKVVGGLRDATHITNLSLKKNKKLFGHFKILIKKSNVHWFKQVSSR